MARWTLSDSQQQSLAERGYRWIQTIRRLDKSGDELLEDFQARPEEARDNIHLIAIALHHLDTCLKILSGAGAQIENSREFRRQSRRISGLRNALEHEEEFIAGRVQTPRLVGAGWREAGFPSPSGFVVADDGISEISVMSVNYVVRPAIDAAIAVEEALSNLAQTP